MLIGALVVAILIGSGAIVWAELDKHPTRGGATPEAAVQGFMAALAGNHAAQALSYETEGIPHAPTFLNDAVLVTAHRADPISKITIDPAAITKATDSARVDTAQVTAHYTVGKASASTTFALHDGKGRVGWTLDQTTISLDLSSILTEKVPLRLAGKAFTGHLVELFPGTYRAGTGTKRLDWGSDPRIQVTGFDTPVETNLHARLTSTGAKDAVAAVTKSAKACLAKHSAKPGCGLVPDTTGYTFKSSTIRWAYDDKSPWKTDDFSQLPADPRTVTGPDNVYAELTAQCAKVARSRDCRKEGFTAIFDQPSVDLTAKTLKVTWG